MIVTFGFYCGLAIFVGHEVSEERALYDVDDLQKRPNRRTDPTNAEKKEKTVELTLKPSMLRHPTYDRNTHYINV